MLNDLTVPFWASVRRWSMLWARDRMWGKKGSQISSLSFAIFGSLFPVCWFFVCFLALNSLPVSLSQAWVHSACPACYFALSLSSVFFPISNYLWVSEVQPRIFHGIFPTSASPFGHCWMFGKESRLWHAWLCGSGAVCWKSYTITHSLAPTALSFLASRKWMKRKCVSMLRTHNGGENWGPAPWSLGFPTVAISKHHVLKQLHFTTHSHPSPR